MWVFAKLPCDVFCPSVCTHLYDVLEEEAARRDTGNYDTAKWQRAAVRFGNAFVATLCIEALAWSTEKRAYTFFCSLIVRTCAATSLVFWTLARLGAWCLHCLNAQRSVTIVHDPFQAVSTTVAPTREPTPKDAERAATHDVLSDGVKALRLGCAAYALRRHVLRYRVVPPPPLVPTRNVRRDCTVINTRGYNGIVTGAHGTHMYISSRQLPTVSPTERVRQQDPRRRAERAECANGYGPGRRFDVLRNIQNRMSVWWRHLEISCRSVRAISFDCSDSAAIVSALDVYATQLELAIACLTDDVRLPPTLATICFATSSGRRPPERSADPSADAQEMAHLLVDEQRHMTLLRITLGAPTLTRERLRARCDLLFSDVAAFI